MGVLQLGSHPSLTGLTDRQAMFALEYLTDLNQTRAAEAAGYAHPNSMSAKLLKNDRVVDAVRALATPKLEAADLSADRVLRQLRDLLFADPADLCGPDGCLVGHLSDAPVSIRQAIESLEANTYLDSKGRPRRHRVRVKLVSKTKVLELALKYLALVDRRRPNWWQAFALA